MLTLGSLFDGIGGFPLAFSRYGFTPLWASEIEPFPIRVTKIRFPDMLHYGDITKLDGGKMWPVDVVTGGSPCQDLSVAGRRDGMKHKALGNDETTRSGLFMEQVRIVREMRDVHGKPRFMVWENVPGALSSNGGEDFRIVLEKTARIADVSAFIPGPPCGKWPACGCIVGDGYSIAWRILDAQYWGVPQRRRRIFLVADFGGTASAEILFKREGLCRDTAKGRKAGKGTAGNAAQGFRETGQGYWGEGVGCLRAEGENRPSRPSNVLVWPETSNTLSRRMDGSPCIDRGPQMVVAGFCPEESAQTRGIGYVKEQSPTLRKETTPAIVAGFDLQQITSPENRSTINPGAPQPSLCAEGRPHVVIPINEQAGHPGGKCNGDMIGKPGDPMYALTERDRHAVAHSLRAQGQMAHREDVDTLVVDTYQQVTGCLSPGAHPGSYNGQDAQNDMFIASNYAVRRLTPLECCRLMGYPDGWCDIPGASDSAQYKAYGNSVAIPCVEYVAEGISEAIK